MTSLPVTIVTVSKEIIGSISNGVTKSIMPTIQEVELKLNQLTSDLSDALTRVDDDVNELKRQVAAGQADQETVNRVAAQIDALRDRIADVDPNPSFPGKSA